MDGCRFPALCSSTDGKLAAESFEDQKIAEAEFLAGYKAKIDFASFLMYLKIQSVVSFLFLMQDW